MGRRLSGPSLVPCADTAADRLRRHHSQVLADRNRLLVHSRHRCHPHRGPGDRSSSRDRQPHRPRSLREWTAVLDGNDRDIPPRRVGGPAAEAPEVREYAKFRVRNTVEIGHELGARFAVYWPGSLGYYVQGAIDELDTLRWYADALNSACDRDIEMAAEYKRATLKHCLEAKPFEPQAEILLPTSDAMLAFIASGLLKHPEMVGLNPEYLHELMWGAAPRAALARALLAGKLFHFDINDGYRLKHDVDIGVGLVNPLDWLNVLVLLRSHGYDGPFNLDYKPPRTTSQFGVFEVSFPTAVD